VLELATATVLAIGIAFAPIILFAMKSIYKGVFYAGVHKIMFEFYFMT